MVKNCVLIVLLFLATAIRAQDMSEYQKASFKHGDFTLPYRVLYPKDYIPEKSYPLILFLHGSG